MNDGEMHRCRPARLGLPGRLETGHMLVGAVGLFLPVSLFVFGALFGIDQQPTISDYFATDLGGLFVAAVCSFAFFLFAFQGTDSREDWISHGAAGLALGVALLPTSSSHNIVHLLHGGFAFLFFLAMAYFAIFVFASARGAAPIERLLHRLFGAAIITCIALILTHLFVRRFCQGPDSECSFVFWLESIALVCFAISWLVEGERRFRREARRSRGPAPKPKTAS